MCILVTGLHIFLIIDQSCTLLENSMHFILNTCIMAGIPVRCVFFLYCLCLIVVNGPRDTEGWSVPAQ